MNNIKNEREEFRSERRTGIGGSDAAAILGISKWKTPLQVYLEKKGELNENYDNDQMLWGHILEPVIREHYANVTGRTVHTFKEMSRNPDYPFMIAHFDGITDDKRGVEIKTARTDDGWGEPGSQNIPNDYFMQIQHYMCVKDLPVFDVPLLIGGSDFRIYEIFADQELQELLIQHENDFWKRVVLSDPPPPTSMQDIQRKFNLSKQKTMFEADQELIELINYLKTIKCQLVELEELQEKTKVDIINRMSGAEVLTANKKTLATWKMNKSPTRFNQLLFQTEHPELYQQYSFIGKANRPFLLK